MKAECPICGQSMTVREWHDDYGLVEIHKSCSCGYLYHWAYGNIIENSTDIENIATELDGE